MPAIAMRVGGLHVICRSGVKGPPACGAERLTTREIGRNLNSNWGYRPSTRILHNKLLNEGESWRDD